MRRKEAYLRHVVAEGEELAARVAVLKAQIAKQNFGVTPERRWELLAAAAAAGQSSAALRVGRLFIESPP